MSDANLGNRYALHGPAYEFSKPGTLLFMDGSPLCGKSTVAPLVAANIAGCALQNMDIIRLAAQEVDAQGPGGETDPVLNFGSCDSYQAIGDGSYSPESLIEGYRRNSEAICRLMHKIVPGLEAQGAADVFFEGVQLLPDIVAPYLSASNKLLVMTSSGDGFDRNREKLFGREATDLHERYSTDRLLLIQGELLRQSAGLPPDQVFRVDNSHDFVAAASSILDFLQATEVIRPVSS